MLRSEGTERLEARLAVAEDGAALAALFTLTHARDFVHAPSEDDVRSVIDEPDRESWVILRDDEIVGHMLIGTDSWLWDIRVIVVRFPRQGIGAFAMRHAIDRAFAHGAHRIFLEVVERNAGARALYERLGFKPEGCYRDGYRNEDGTYENLIPYGMLAAEVR
ncbi:MAG: GNAT family N-acetyltransferase [Candidatus Eremiobacteraeota bacterium]|nr:GNAT family N-acetyltransferase [Candidatus Eremiobacteraeota bacterium]